MIYDKINKLIKERVSQKMKFYTAVGMTSTGFNKMMEKKTLRVDTLILIAKYFNVSICSFFEKEVQVNQKEVQMIENKDGEVLGLFRENRELRKEIERLKNDLKTIRNQTGAKKLN